MNLLLTLFILKLKTYKETTKVKEWQQAMKEELIAIQKNGIGVENLLMKKILLS